MANIKTRKVTDFSHSYVADSKSGWRAGLKKVLNEWIHCLALYVDDPVLGAKYNPFSYNERVHVSFLAAAAWRCGFVAMEEFRTRKGDDKAVGRGDLMLKLGKTVLCIEAKNFDPNLEKYPEPWEFAGRKLRKARRDADKVNLAAASSLERAGVVFMAPKLKGVSDLAFAEYRAGFVDHLQAAAKKRSSSLVTTDDGHAADFWAAYFPAKAAELRQVEAAKKRLPGVVLLGSTLEFRD